MPRIHGTRKLRAEELIERLERGPQIDLFLASRHGERLTREEQATLQLEMDLRVRAWLRSWIIEEVRDLVPELRKKGGAR